MTDKSNGSTASPVGGVLVGFGKSPPPRAVPVAVPPPAVAVPPPDPVPAAPPARDPLVGVVGLGFHTLTVADLCDEAGLRVGFAVDDREGADGDPCGAAYWMGIRGIPVLSAAEFAERARRRPGGLTLVAGRVDCPLDAAVADDAFVRAAAWVRRTTGRDSLRHPISLLGRVPPAAWPDRYAVFGYPGSGNVLTQNMVAGLYARRPVAPPTPWAMRAGLAEYFFHSTVARLRHLLAPLAVESLGFYTHDFGRLMVTADCGNDRLGIALDVPCLHHHSIWNYLTHVRPTGEAIDYLTAGGCRCVAVVRHPCETLLSMANKTARPARTTFDHPLFLDRLADGLADWMASLQANRERVRVVRYEDLAARDVGALRALAGWLGFDLPDADAEALFDRFLNRNLPAAVPSHFFRGGSDKWRAEFEPRDLRRVLARLPAEAFTAFGYEVPTDADLTPTTLPPVTPTKPPAHQLLLLESYPYTPVGGPFGIRVTGTDPEVTGRMAAAFRDPDLLALFAAGGLTGDSRPQPAFELAAA